MQFMDVFVREQWDDMGAFIDNVSDPTAPFLSKGFEGFIDLGKEFAKLHAFFVEVLPTLTEVSCWLITTFVASGHQLHRVFKACFRDRPVLTTVGAENV